MAAREDPVPTSSKLTQPRLHLQWTADHKRHQRAMQKWFRQWLKRVDRWEKLPGYQGVTFPGLKDGDRLAEELVAFARKFVRERIV